MNPLYFPPSSFNFFLLPLSVSHFTFLLILILLLLLLLPLSTGGKRQRDDLGSTNVIIKRLSISSALPPSQSDDLYDEKEDENFGASAPSEQDHDDSNDDVDFTAPLSYDADNERDRTIYNMKDGSDGRVARSIRVRDEFDHATEMTPSSPNFMFYGNRNRGDGPGRYGYGDSHLDENDYDGDENDGSSNSSKKRIDYNVNRDMDRRNHSGNGSSSDSDSSYMLPRVKDRVTSKLVRGRNPATRVDLLIDDVSPAHHSCCCTNHSS